VASRSPRPLQRAALLALLGALTSGGAGSAQAVAPEAAIKATYLYKFAPFVDWPASAFPSQSSPFYVCVLGSDPFGGTLDQAVMGQRVNEHPVAVRRLRNTQDGDACHILYLGISPGNSTETALRDLRGAPVLTVSDHRPGVSGAIIQFVVKDGRLRFNIDPAAAAANGVMISSKLMSLALSVKAGG